MESTDTPDFFYEEGDARGGAKDIGFTDGILGSTGLDKMKKQPNKDPGISKALEVDPNIIGGYVSASAAAAGVKFELDTLAKMGRFTQEVSMACAAGSTTGAQISVDVKPVCMGFEDYYAGWSAESDKVFSVDPEEGRMERKGGAPTQFTVTLTPNNQVGEKIGYLIVMLPEENEQFTIKVTAKLF